MTCLNGKRVRLKVRVLAHAFYPKIFQKDNSIELLAKKPAGPVYYILAISRARVAARASISTAEKDCDSF